MNPKLKVFFARSLERKHTFNLIHPLGSYNIKRDEMEVEKILLGRRGPRRRKLSTLYRGPKA